jgi:methyl-accepting chemotaxis protein
MIHSWTFQKKLAAGFAVTVGMTVVIAAVAIYALTATVASKDRVIAVNAQNLIDAAKLDAASDQQAAGFRGFLVAADDRFLRERDAATREFHAATEALESRVYTAEGKRLLSDIRRADVELLAAQDLAIETRRGARSLEAGLRVFDETILPWRDRLVQTTNGFVDRQQRLLEDAERASTAQASLAITALAILALAAVLFAFVTALFLSRALTSQIGSAVQHVQSSSAELQTTANQQASGAREAATSMNEISTTMSELLVTSRQISESSQQVARMAQETAGAARTGGETVAKMQEAIEAIHRQVDLIVTHMLDLGKKSQQIGGILDLINELAEQTNILSINATIEAVGAGEAGKRFAVVGDEIRKLADRVTNSTKEVRVLVDDIRSAVNTTVLATEGGAKAVDAGLRHFEEVTHGFKQITGLVATTTEAAREIELSTKQQMTAVQQVNTAIGGATLVSRETEASSTQTLQTATQLAHLSEDLSQIVQPRKAA